MNYYPCMPYLFIPDVTGTVTFSGNINSGLYQPYCVSGEGGWSFNGTFSNLTYGTAPMTGHVYGFASSNKTVQGKDVEAGEFVKAISGAKVKPFRCYLTYNGSGARGVTRGETEELPSRIIVRLVGADGSTTAIGTMDTRSGEVSLRDGTTSTAASSKACPRGRASISIMAKR